ncbi:MAG: porin [Rhodospirillales bacterium]|nr:porin [Rhodospirillales bacterium]
MKKTLLGTTALVSAGLVAQNAQAADPIELSIGGFQTWGFYTTDVDDSAKTDPGFGTDNHDLFYSGELLFSGKTVLDNGLEVGLRFELEGETSGDQLDETYVYVEGAFGTLRIGNDDDVAAQLGTAAPYLSYIFGANSPTVFANGISNFMSRSVEGAVAANPGFTAPAGGLTIDKVTTNAANGAMRELTVTVPEDTVVVPATPAKAGATPGGALKSRFAAGATSTLSTFAAYGGDRGRIMYFTPVFNGFQFGVSYSPNAGETGNGGTYELPEDTDTASVSVAGNYNGQLGDVGVTFSAGYVNIDADNGNDTVMWNTGLSLSMDNWSIGGSYQDVSDQGNVEGTDSQTFDVGVSYTSDGPWAVGIYWLNAEVDYAKGNLHADRGVTDEFDIYRLQGRYTLGPGINLHGAVGLDTIDDGVINTDYDSTFVGGALAVSF